VAERSATIIGAGIIGLWQAFELARRGFAVRLFEAAEESAMGAASRYAGAMLAPYCEAEAAPPIVTELGLRGLERWRRHYPAVASRGTLVFASSRDEGELGRFSRVTSDHVALDAAAIAAIEPELAMRFDRGLFYTNEAHLEPRPAMAWLVRAARSLGAEIRFQVPVPEPLRLAAPAGEIVIDCRGIAARTASPELRGVRGEMAVVHTDRLRLSRPVRLLHPRFPLYIVPWSGDRYMLGATMIETDDARPVTVRSALELLASAVAVHPAFGSARIVEFSAGIRPAFPNNLPAITLEGRRLSVNGAYRHGFLLAPVLAQMVGDFLEHGTELPVLSDA
jgi:glycine oxidase